MSLRWILPLLAAACLGTLLWLTSPRHRVSPQERLEAARTLLAATPADIPGALRELEEALRLARGDEWGVLRAAVLRERAKLYAGRGLVELALADCRAELAEFGPHAETLARAADLCLKLDEPGQALEYAEQLTALTPARGKGRVGRAQLAMADAPLSSVQRLAHSSLALPDSASVLTLAQRAAVFGGDPSLSTVALEDLLERFPRAEERRKVAEWVHEASEHLGLAAAAFVESLQGSTGEAVAGLQDLLLRGDSPREAIDLGLVALGLPNLANPMPVLARTAGALTDLGRLETARALILEIRKRNPAALRPQDLPNLEVTNELRNWCLVLERLGLWDDLRLAAWELSQRSRDDQAEAELAIFLAASAELAQNQLQPAERWLAGLGVRPVEQYDLGVRVWLARAALARRTRQRAQERYALLLATKAAPLDPLREPLRADVGRAWQRLYELQESEGDLLAAEVSLTHALRCSSARASEIEPLWHELGNRSLATRGASSPYLVYTRARAAAERGEAEIALTDARELLEHYPGLGPALEVVSRAANRLHDYPRMIAASLEILERGWSGEGASARLRAVPKEYFLPQDRVRWLSVDPRGSLEDVLRKLLAQGDRTGAALAARGGPARYQPIELLPLLARVEFDEGATHDAFQTLDLLPVDSAPFRSCTGLVLEVALARLTSGGKPQALANAVAKVVSSAPPEDEGLVDALDLLLALGRLDEARSLLDWMAPGPFLGQTLLRSSVQRALTGAAPREDEDLERAAALLDDGLPELGRVLLASARDDASTLAREARTALETELARAPAQRAALLALAGDPPAAARALGALAFDGRDFQGELVAAALAELAPADEGGAPAAPGARLSPFLLERLAPSEILVLALAAENPPFGAWTLARTRDLPETLRADPWVRGLEARVYMALSQPGLARAPLGDTSSDVRLAWLLAESERARGAPAEVVLTAELAWFALAGVEAGNDPELLLLTAEREVRVGEREAAVRVLEGGLERRPDDPRLLARLAELEDTSGRRTRALELYTRLLERLPARTDEPAVLRVLDVLRAARDEGEISEARWWAEVEALEAERPADPAPARELAARSIERPLGGAEQARSHALQRLERLRARNFGRALEPLRPGEVGRWTRLLARFSPERALAFADEELLRDPVDPALWRASAEARLAVGRWQDAIARLEALQKVAPERETGRLLALTSFRFQHGAREFARRLADIRRFDERALEDADLAFYDALAATLLEAPKAAKPAEGAPPVASADGLARARELWNARADNGLADAEHGRALALALFQEGRREDALAVLDEARPLVASQLERDLFAALAYLIRSAPATPRHLQDAPLPPRLEETRFDDAPAAGAAGKPPRPGAGKAAQRKGAQPGGPAKGPGPRKKK